MSSLKTMPMTLYDIIGPQPSTGPEGPNPEGLEWIISTEIDKLRSEIVDIQEDGDTFRREDRSVRVRREHNCEAKILYLEMELARIQLELRILLDR